jgi:hypothetical protein
MKMSLYSNKYLKLVIVAVLSISATTLFHTATVHAVKAPKDNAPSLSGTKERVRTICVEVATGAPEKACKETAIITHVFNIATQKCDGADTLENYNDCINQTSQDYFNKAANSTPTPTTAKDFTNAVEKELKGQGNINKPSSKKPKPDTSSCQNSGSFFGLKAWYHYLPTSADGCDVKGFNLLPSDSKPSDVPLVLLAIVDDLLRIAGLAAVGFVLLGAIKYIGSQGDPEGVSKAQGTIVNALLGLAIAIVSVAFVSFLGNKLGG